MTTLRRVLSLSLCFNSLIIYDWNKYLSFIGFSCTDPAFGYYLVHVGGCNRYLHMLPIPFLDGSKQLLRICTLSQPTPPTWPSLAPSPISCGSEASNAARFLKIASLSARELDTGRPPVRCSAYSGFFIMISTCVQIYLYSAIVPFRWVNTWGSSVASFSFVQHLSGYRTKRTKSASKIGSNSNSRPWHYLEEQFSPSACSDSSRVWSLWCCSSSPRKLLHHRDTHTFGSFRLPAQAIFRAKKNAGRVPVRRPIVVSWTRLVVALDQSQHC